MRRELELLDNESELLGKAATFGCDKHSVHDAIHGLEQKCKKNVHKQEIKLKTIGRKQEAQKKAIAKGGVDPAGGKTEAEWAEEIAEANRVIAAAQKKRARKSKAALVKLICDHEHERLGSCEDIKVRKELETIPTRAALKKRALAAGCSRSQLDEIVQFEHTKAKPAITAAEQAQYTADRQHQQAIQAKRNAVGDVVPEEEPEHPDDEAVALANAAEEQALAANEAEFDAAIHAAGDDEDAKAQAEMRHDEERNRICREHPLNKVLLVRDHEAPKKSDEEWILHRAELTEAIKVVHAKLTKDTMEAFIVTIIEQERINRAEADAREELDPAELQARFERLQRQAQLKQTAISKMIFVLFLAFPGECASA